MPLAHRWYYQNKDRALELNRLNKLMSRYGMTPEDYDEMVTAQAGVCAICGDVMDPPNLDHNHDTGSPRGLLCGYCNRGLGQFRDDVTRLARAITYLGQYA